MLATPLPCKRTGPKLKIGIAGTGFIALGLMALAAGSPDLAVSRVLTRRCRDSVKGVAPELLTNSVYELVDESDVVVECSGDVAHGADVADAALQSGKKMVTMGAEFQVTCGSYFAERGWFSEAEGDQHGKLEELDEEAVGMVFRPLVYGYI